MNHQVEVEQAVDLLLAQPVWLNSQIIPVAAARGRVAAAALFAPEMSPAFDRSPFDGYAVRGEETAAAARERPAVFRVTQEIRAGDWPSQGIGPGCAAKILTGAPLPPGANTTVKYEHTEFSADQVKIFQPLPPGTNVVRAGEGVRQGEALIQAGTLVTPPVTGLLAGVGIATVPVYRRPLVTLFSTGSELLPLTEPLRPGLTRDSNYYTLSGFLAENGLETRAGGLLADDPDLIAGHVAAALETSDCVLTSGGVSVGDYDYLATVGEKLGGKPLFSKVAMKPGGCLLATVINGKLLLGLSGSPGAAVTGLIRVALPYLRKLCGRQEPLPREITARLAEDFPKESRTRRFLQGRLLIREGQAWFSRPQCQGNAMLKALVGCDMLADIPAGSPRLAKGDKVRLYPYA
mgnify:CR=1 FL=1